MLSGLEAAELPADAIEVGRISDAWGIKGWFKILPYSANPEALFSSKHWFLLPTEKGVKTFSGTVQMAVKEVKEHSDTVVACARDVDDRNAAEALRGARIFVSRASFPAAAQDEYYWVDLIGLNVVNRQDEDLGIVRELLSTGPQTVLVLEYQQDGKPQERMIPFVSAYVDEVDLAAKRIRVDWLADY
ncbi:ribosome maturation factor RimM [Rhodoferax sp.]|uniref:ribosome maturation factor RimM n=1 Tax=Rhodoferax sp. TaxID=50421 RepID=UPI002ACD2DB7|nr:ribosome maturation factor RimM [Rhodoferax sp.]MDZ7921643.1 ribosome maturation factor RimM [Rhodoferax sp.]